MKRIALLTGSFFCFVTGCGRIDARSEIGTVIILEEWLQRNTTKYYCPCDQVKDNEQLIPRLVSGESPR